MSKASEAQVNAIYTENYKGRGLAPKHVVALKEAIAVALKKGEDPQVAAKALFKEKGITLGAKKARGKTVARAPVQEQIMDRKELRATIKELVANGVNISYDKSESDAELTAKVNAALEGMSSGALTETLSNLDPTKIGDCYGVYVDLRHPGCGACAASVACVKVYVVNAKDNFAAFSHAFNEIQPEAATGSVVATASVVEAASSAETDEEEGAEEEADPPADHDEPVPKPARVAKQKKAGGEEGFTPIVPAPPPAATYDPKMKIFLMAVPNPLPDEHKVFATMQKIVDDPRGVMTARQLRSLIKTDWDVSDDGMFVTEWLNGLRQEGVIKFEEDLTDDERAQLGLT